MNHHLTEKDAAWVAGQGEFAISGCYNEPRLEARLHEEEKRVSLILRFEKKMGSVKAAAEYFEVSPSAWRAWRSGDRLPPVEICFHVQKATK